MAITRPRAFGAFSGGRYASFARQGAATPGHALTQLRTVATFSGRRYGDFAGRSAAPTRPPLIYAGGAVPVQKSKHPHKGLRRKRVEEDEALLLAVLR